MSYEIFVQQLDQAEEIYTKLKRQWNDTEFILAGELDIVDVNGKLWDTYRIEIKYQEGFPFRFPALFETSNKIPKIGDWHIYEDTLSCCVKVKPAEIIRCVNGISLTEYINDEVLPYFFNQTHRRLEGYYVNGEYGHGSLGIYQFYSEELCTGDDIKKTLRLIHFIATHRRPSRTSICFCGNNTKFRNCHRESFDKLKIIGDQVLLSHCYEIGKAAGIL